MNNGKIYRTVKRPPPPVVELPMCDTHNFKKVQQRTVWEKYNGNFPTVHIEFYQTCSGCGWEQIVGYKK